MLHLLLALYLTDVCNKLKAMRKAIISVLKRASMRRGMYYEISEANKGNKENIGMLCFIWKIKVLSYVNNQYQMKGSYKICIIIIERENKL